MTVIKAYTDRNSTRIQTAGGALFFQEAWMKEKAQTKNDNKNSKK